MSSPFQSIGLFSAAASQAVDTLLQTVWHYLTSRFLSVQRFPLLGSTAKNAPVTSPSYDLLIAIGGDGTLLQAAQHAVANHIPVLGIHRGRLGFLADIRAPDFEEQLGAVLDGHYQIEPRFLLEADIISADGQCIAHELALNEAVLMSGDVAHMISFTLTLDEAFVYTQRANGLIVATPTGSTAYALSGGGPIVHPDLPAFVLVPMYPHTLGAARPLVVSADSTIQLQVTARGAPRAPGLTCDGRPPRALPPEAKIRLRRHTQALQLVHPPEYQYFNALRNKLGFR